MPIYEVEHGGQTYEVEASSPEQAALAFGSAPASQAKQPQEEFEPFGLFTFPASGPEMNTQESSRMAGIPEGLQRVKAGVMQAGGAVADFFTRNDKAGRGLKDQVTAEELLRATTADAEARERGLDMQTRDRTATLTQLGTLAIAPEAALPRATTVTGAAVKNFLSGGIGGAATFEPEGSKLDDTLGGGALSTTFGLVPSIPPAMKNVVGKGLARVAREGRTARRVANAEQTLPNTTFSLAQRTGVPELSYLEHRAYNLDQVNFFADQTDQFIADAADALAQPIKQGQTLGGDVAIFKKSMDDQIGNIRKNASKSFEYGLSKAATLAGPDTTVNIDNFRNVAREVLPTLKAVKEASEDLPISNAYIANLERMVASGKAMTVQELNTALRQLTALQKSTNPEAKAMATRLRNDGIEADLDAVEKMPTQEPAVTTLLETRAEYRRAMQAANLLSEHAAYKLVGSDNPAEIIANVKGFSREKQAAVREFLANNSPDLLRSLKQGIVADAVQKSGVIREAADAQQDLAKFQDAMFDGDTFRASGLFSPAELKRAEGIADGLRVIQNNRPRLTTAGTPVAPEDVAINLISRSGPFMARFLTRALTGSKASQFFTDPNIYNLMTKMNRSTTGSATNLASRALLINYLQEEYGSDQQ
jgi:hypothetical protein